MVCVYRVEAETWRQLPMYGLCLLGGARILAAVTHVCFVFTGRSQNPCGSYPCMFCVYWVEAETSPQLPMYVLCVPGRGRHLAAVTHVCFVFTEWRQKPCGSYPCMFCVYWVEADTSRQLPLYGLCLLGRGRNLAAVTHVCFVFTEWRQKPCGSYPCMFCVYWVEADTLRQLPMYVLCLLGRGRHLAAATHV